MHSPIGYRPDIDALRGIAVLLVVAFHAFPDLVPGGFVGVDVFFVISGYLITGIILRGSLRGSFSLLEFYSRRIRRLFPALIVVLLTTLGLGWWLLFPDELDQLGHHAFYSAVYLLNFKLITEIGYFDVESHYKPLLHLWSLSVEEQFYLVWPLVLYGLLRWGTKALVLVLATMFVLSFGGAVYYGGEDFAHYQTLTRIWQLSVGALLAVTFGNAKTQPRPLVAVAGVIGIAAYAFVDSSGFSNRLALSIVPVVGAAAILWSRVPGHAFGGLRAVGLVSYPLYLWHWVAISFVTIYLGRTPSTTTLTCAVLVSVLLAWLTYRYIEWIRYREGTTSPYLLAVLVVVGLGGLYAHERDGFPDRPHLAYLEGHKVQFERTPSTDDPCDQYVQAKTGRPRTFDYCRSSGLDADRLVALIGDSHAHAFFPGLAAEARDRGFGIVLAANSGCPPFRGFRWGRDEGEAGRCVEMIDQIYDLVRGDPRIERVVITTRGPVYLHGEVDRGWSEASLRKSLETIENPLLTYEALAASFRSSVLELEALPNIQRVLHLLENPELDFRPKEVIPRPYDPFEVARSENTIARNLYARRMARYRAAVEPFDEATKLLALDPAVVLCDEAECESFRDGEFLYADDDHYSVHGSHVMAGHFALQIFGDVESAR